MKHTVRILSILCALALMLSLAACGGSSGTSEETVEEVVKADYGWVKFVMPEGYEDAEESKAYVTIREKDNDKHCIKFFVERLFSGDSLEAKLEKEAEDDYYTIDEKFTTGDRVWAPMRFTFNGNPSVKLYTVGDAKNLVYLTVYEMEENDPAVDTILKSIEFDSSLF